MCSNEIIFYLITVKWGCPQDAAISLKDNVKEGVQSDINGECASTTGRGRWRLSLIPILPLPGWRSTLFTPRSFFTLFAKLQARTSKLHYHHARYLFLEYTYIWLEPSWSFPITYPTRLPFCLGITYRLICRGAPRRVLVLLPPSVAHNSAVIIWAPISPLLRLWVRGCAGTWSTL